MPRLMSVSMTEDAVVARRKTVTRRNGWTFLKPGDRLTLCRKVMGRQGAPLVRLAEVEVVSVRREPLRALIDAMDYGFAELELEGVTGPNARDPWITPLDFVDEYFVRAQGMSPDAEVTRIEWRYLDGAGR